MSFRVIKGTFHVVGYSPDGDSIRFKAVNEANWALLEARRSNSTPRNTPSCASKPLTRWKHTTAHLPSTSL
jgi:hypothetical protein